MFEFTHVSTRYKVKPENAQAMRDILAKPKKHKPEALSSVNLKRSYPIFQIGMSTAGYVSLFNRLNSRLMHHGIDHGCPNYHKPAQTIAGLKKQIRAALDALAAGDIDNAQCILNEAMK